MILEQLGKKLLFRWGYGNTFAGGRASAGGTA